MSVWEATGGLATASLGMNGPTGQATGGNIASITANDPQNIAQSIPMVAPYGAPSLSNPNGGLDIVNNLPSGENAPVTASNANLYRVVGLLVVVVGGVYLWSKYGKGRFSAASVV